MKICKFCGKETKNPHGLKIHVNACKNKDVKDVEWLNLVSKEASKFRKENNPMKREEVKIKHKSKVQKKDRPDWRANSSKSLKGKKVGGGFTS